MGTIPTLWLQMFGESETALIGSLHRQQWPAFETWTLSVPASWGVTRGCCSPLLFTGGMSLPPIIIKKTPCGPKRDAHQLNRLEIFSKKSISWEQQVILTFSRLAIEKSMANVYQLR